MLPCYSVCYAYTSILLLSLFVVNANVHAQLVNGDFQGSFSSSCSAGDGWTFSTGDGMEPQITEIYEGTNYWIDLTPCNAWGNGTWIEQTASTIEGHCYHVTLDIGSWTGWDMSDAGMYIFIDGVQLGERLYNDVFESDPDPLAWQNFSSEAFIASSSQVVIRIMGEGHCTNESPTDGFYACISESGLANPGVMGLDNVVLVEDLSTSLSLFDFEDETICDGEVITIGVDNDDFSFQWSTGDTTSTISVSEPGIYTLEYSGSCGTGEVVVEISESNSPALFSLGNDSVVCSPFTINIIGPSLYTYWSTGEMALAIDVDEAGSYAAYVQNECGIVRDTIVITNGDVTEFEFGQHFILCEGHKLLIEVPAEVDQYQWSTGDDTPTIEISEGGNYWIEGISTCDVVHKDFSVEESLCECIVFVPNVFTANSDGLNDGWRPIVTGDCQMKAQVWNRWGEKIFETKTLSDSWRGETREGHYYAPDGIYYYIVEYASGNIYSKTLTGTITLLR